MWLNYKALILLFIENSALNVRTKEVIIINELNYNLREVVKTKTINWSLKPTQLQTGNILNSFFVDDYYVLPK